MQPVLPNQITKLHILLNKLGMIDEKRFIVYQLTEGRTQSTKDLTYDEAASLIKSLSDYVPAERQKSLIFSLAYKAGLICGDTPEDKRMNTAKLNAFLVERGAVKKPLNEMTYDELVLTHRQFEGMLKNVKAAKAKKAFNNEFKSLLNEFNISAAL